MIGSPAGRHRGARFARDECVEAVHRLLACGRDDGGAMFVMCAPLRRGDGNVLQRRCVCAAKPRHVAAGELHQRLGASCAQGDHRRARHLHMRGSVRVRLGPAKNDVRIRAAEAERVHPCRCRTRRHGPRLEPGHHTQMPAVEIDVGIRCVEVQRRRQLAVLHTERRLDQAGDSRRGLEMTDVRLHRSDRTAFPLAPALAQHGTQCPRLDRVANRRARAVRFHVVQIRRMETRTGQRFPQHRLLRPGARHGHPVRAPILVDRTAHDDGVHLVAVGKGRRERLQHHDAGAFAADVPVR